MMYIRYGTRFGHRCPPNLSADRNVLLVRALSSVTWTLPCYIDIYVYIYIYIYILYIIYATASVAQWLRCQTHTQ